MSPQGSYIDGQHNMQQGAVSSGRQQESQVISFNFPPLLMQRLCFWLKHLNCYTANLFSSRFHQRNGAIVWQAVLFTPVWAFVLKKNRHTLNVYRMDYRAYGLWGHIFCACAVKHEAEKHPNSGDSTNHNPPCHWVMSPAKWGTWEAAEWALTGAQLWTDEHWKHTHVHMRHMRSIS